jgi:hypothetical protein
VFALKTNAQTYYIYSDSNSNTYTLDQGKLVYTPVNPEESSSGTYNGGKGAKKGITKDTFKNLSKLIDKAMSDKTGLQEKREMGTGQMVKNSKGKKKIVIFKSDSRYKEKIETLFKDLLKQD